MDTPSAIPAEPPSPTAESFLVRAFGFATDRYWTFLELLIDGLQMYEAMQVGGGGGGGHAPTPVPAA